MNAEDRAHAKDIADWFSVAMVDKYHRGTVEHGGYLPRKGGLLAEAEAECLDLPVYVRTLRAQLTRIHAAMVEDRHDEALASLSAILFGTPEDRLQV